MNWLYDLWDDFLSLLFPRICYGCGNHLLRNENIICTECYVVIPRTNYHTIRENPVEQIFWGRCKIESAAAFSYYNKGSRIRNLIHNLKYKGIKEIGFELGRIYGLSLKSSGFTESIDLIIPVPLHPAKKRSRGFNQSEIIAEGISAATGIQVNTRAVIRTVSSSTQTKRSRYERWVNVEGIFSIKDPDLIRGKHILLIDDVITTGATMESCINELLKTEGVKVSVAAIAYAPA
ncbi:MAG: ComF family protein [Bacteroidetes bacterium]|nr:ComF family protein [Bacteroidota bacterium]